MFLEHLCRISSINRYGGALFVQGLTMSDCIFCTSLQGWFLPVAPSSLLTSNVVTALKGKYVWFMFMWFTRDLLLNTKGLILNRGSKGSFEWR